MFYSTKSRIGSGLSDVKRRVFPEKHLEETIYKVAELFNVPEKLVKDNLPEITHGKGRYYPKENKISTTGNISEDIENSARFLRAACRGYAGKGYPSVLEIMISRFFGEIPHYPLGLESSGKKCKELLEKYKAVEGLQKMIKSMEANINRLGELKQSENIKDAYLPTLTLRDGKITIVSKPIRNLSEQITDVIKERKELKQYGKRLLLKIVNSLYVNYMLQIWAHDWKKRGVDLYEEMMKKDPQAIFKDNKEIFRVLREISEENKNKLSD